MNKKKKLQLLSEYFNEPVTIKMRQEYKSLFIGDKMITQGESEVERRIEVLIKENGLQYDLGE